MGLTPNKHKKKPFKNSKIRHNIAIFICDTKIIRDTNSFNGFAHHDIKRSLTTIYKPLFSPPKTAVFGYCT